jgi:hypothetical protein
MEHSFPHPPNEVQLAEACALARRDLHEGRMRQALQRMVAGLTAFFRSHWRWKGIQTGKLTVDRTLILLIDEAIDAGAPLDQALEPVRELEAYVRSRYPSDVPSLAECLRRETDAEGAANRAEVAAALEPTPLNLRRLAVEAAKHEGALVLMLERVTRDVQDHPRPMGVPTGRVRGPLARVP